MTSRTRRYLIPWLGFAVALGLHLWHLGLPNTMTGDEVFFVRDAQSYLVHQSYFDPHPPFGKVLIGSMIAVFGDTAFVWRLGNAVLGALLVPLIWWLAWRLTKREGAAHLAATLTLLDGLLLVDSRMGVINMPLIVLSVVGVAAILKALEHSRPRWWLVVAGTALGLSISTKWIGMLAVVPALSLWFWPKIFGQPRLSPWNRSEQWWSIGWLIAWPIIIYVLIFAWHFAWLHLPSSFWATNVDMLNYHLSVPSTGDPHAQPWSGWLLAWRPFLYNSSIDGDTVRTIAALPNPWLWWSGAAVFLVSLWRGWRAPATRLLNIFLLFAWLPFALIQRVMYSYHMLLFDVWLLVLLAIWLDRQWARRRWFVLAYVALAAIVWLWFFPLYTNQPLSTVALQWRWWLPSWNLRL